MLINMIDLYVHTYNVLTNNDKGKLSTRLNRCKKRTIANLFVLSIFSRVSDYIVIHTS